MKPTADNIIVLLNVDDKLYQVALSEDKRDILMGFLHAMFDGPIKVIDQDLPIKIKEKVKDNET